FHPYLSTSQDVLACFSYSFIFSSSFSFPFFSSRSADPRHLHSFPTRRSSDLHERAREAPVAIYVKLKPARRVAAGGGDGLEALRSEEQRLNSSHVAISYAVFCLKKKKKKTKNLNHPC